MATLRSKLILALVDRVTARAKGVNRALENMKSRQAANARQLRATQGEMIGAAGVAYALGRALKAPLNAAANFQSGMNRVQALSGATADQFDAMRKQALELGRSTQFSAAQAADAMGFLAMAGFDAQQVMASMPGTLQLAASAGMDLASSADIVSNVLTGYNLQVDQLGRVNDVLVKTFTSANTDLRQLGEAMKYAGPVASAAGMGFETAAASIALMGNAGIQGTMAGTSLRGAISRILSPTKKMAKAMKRAGLSFTDSEGRLKPMEDIVRSLEPHAQDAGLFMELFGQRAGPAMAALVSQGADALRDLDGELRNSEGVAAKIAAVNMQGLNGVKKALSSATEGVLIALGDTFLPILTQLGTAFVPILQATATWIEANPQLTASIVGVISALIALRVAAIAARFAFLWMNGGLISGAIVGLKGFSKAATGAKTAITRLRAAAAGAIMLNAVGGSSALAASLTAVAAPMAALKAAAIGVAAAIGAISWPIIAVIAAVAALAAAVYHYWEPISNFVVGFASVVGAALSDVASLIAGFGAKIASAAAGWVVDRLVDIGAMLGIDEQVVRDAVAKAVGAATSVVNAIKNALSNAASAIGGWLSNAFSMRDYSDKMESEFRSAGERAGRAMLEAIKAIPMAIVQVFQGLGSKIAAAVGSINWSSLVPSWARRFISDGDVSVSGEGSGIDGTRAVGGNVVGGRTYLVGEKGPELVTPQRSGYVHTAKKTAAMGGGSVNMGGVNVSIHVNGDVDAERLAREIEPHLSQMLQSSMDGIQADTEWAAS